MRIAIENFKSLKRIEMVLGDATVLIGPPASGKSNILDAIAFTGYFHRFRVLGEEYGNDVHFLEPLMSIARFSDPRNLFPFYDTDQDIAISVTGEANVRRVARFEHGSVKVYINDVEVPWNIGTSPAVTRIDVIDAVKSANVLPEARLYSYDRYGLGIQSCDTKSCGFGYLVSNAVYARQYPVNILNDLGWNATYILLRSPHIVSDINKEFAEGCNEKVEIHVLRSGEGFSSHIILYNLMFFIASSPFPCTPLGSAYALGAFRATPGTPHLGLLPLGRALCGLFTPHREPHQDA